MLKFIMPLLAASALSAQVSMPVSPVLGSPTLLIVNWNSAQTTGPLVLIMHTNPGQVQGSCYLSLTRDGASVTAALYRTTTSTPEEPVGGLIGSAPWYYPTISSNACTIYLNDSVVNGNEIRLRIENGVTPYNKQVVGQLHNALPAGCALVAVRLGCQLLFDDDWLVGRHSGGFYSANHLRFYHQPPGRICDDFLENQRAGFRASLLRPNLGPGQLYYSEPHPKSLADSDSALLNARKYGVL